jgi:hypothetical protein
VFQNFLFIVNRLVRNRIAEENGLNARHGVIKIHTN